MAPQNKCNISFLNLKIKPNKKIKRQGKDNNDECQDTLSC